MIMVSACLTGRNCKYSGGNNYRPEIAELSGEKIEFCPEHIGGLPIPRAPSEIEEGYDGFDVIDGKAKVFDKNGTDVTAQFVLGAIKALETVLSKNIRKVYFKQSSPSCGCGLIYDGTFGGVKKPGFGVTAALLKRNNIEVIGIE